MSVKKSSKVQSGLRQPTKAIIPAAGLGTRFLPQTKAMPKEMLPIIDKPVIQLVVEELVVAGVTEIIIVTGSTKRAVEDHFDRASELEDALRAKGKDDKAEVIEKIGNMANFVYVRQKGFPLGNARPVINAQHLIDDDEPFFVLAADDFFTGKVPRAVQMLEAFNRTGGKSIVSLSEVDPKVTAKYGVAELGKDLGDGLYEMKGTVEKPAPKDAPSNYMIPLGYLLTPNILPIIAQEKLGHSGELVLVDSINELIQSDTVYGQVIEGVYHDTGDPEKYLRTLFDITLDHPQYGERLREYLRQKV